MTRETGELRGRNRDRTADIIPHHLREGMDPPPGLGRMSTETPLVPETGPGLIDWVATGREEVRAILGDADRFSTRPPADTEEESRQITQIGNPLMYDPPEHTRLRKLLAPEFTLRRMRRIEPQVERIIEDRLDVLERAGRPADLVRHFAWPIPGLVGCTLLGIPRDDQAELARHLDLSRRDNRGWQARRASAKTFDNYLARYVATRRRDPGDDLVSMLVKDHGTDVSDKELVGLAASVMAAGIENMVGMLGLGVLALLDHPDQLALLRERPELMGQAVEELLRYVTVVAVASPRTALTEVTVGDHVIEPGQVVSCSFLAVNRAQPPGAPPDRLDILREGTTHVAFGHGIHYCAGAALARMELRIAFAGVLRRFPGLRLAVPREELRFRPPWMATFGIENLPVSW
ncbi:cytochrome P450 [Streptomyces griseoviridis]|uniref:Cytochrome P450 n=1 Tax=Streptomyces griseoviridis TaxID=45398 RepID=A0A918GWK0_STRGD|nr:cytochrome P450 [Streptomyces niveoruber]GGS69513.1 cytochrome P450 [Streptomyces niveoruber]